MVWLEVKDIVFSGGLNLFSQKVFSPALKMANQFENTFSQVTTLNFIVANL